MFIIRNLYDYSRVILRYVGLSQRTRRLVHDPESRASVTNTEWHVDSMDGLSEVVPSYGAP